MTNGKYAPVPGKIPGKALNLGGVDFVAPPFNLDGVQEAIVLLDSLRDAKTAEDSLKGAAAVLMISLRRNYPDLTIEELHQLVDFGNWEDAVLSVCGLSGIKFAKPGESPPASP